MTVDQRNLYFKGGILLSLFCLILLIVLAGTLLPSYPDLCGGALRRPEGFLQSPIERFFPTTPPAVFGSLVAAAFYTLCTSLLLFVFFEKTHSPEILFMGLFAVSFSFETLRIAIPLQTIYVFPTALLTAGTRLLFFGRFFGAVSLFVSSLYASGLDTQRQGKTVTIMLIAISMIAIRIPVSGQSWDTSLAMITGYGTMFRITGAILIAVTIASFLVAAYTKGTREYLFVALGVFLALVGRSLLIASDTWTALALGLLMLAGGTWLIMLWLHRVYLWL